MKNKGQLYKISFEPIYFFKQPPKPKPKKRKKK